MFYLGDNYKDRFVLPDPNEATAEFSMEDLADDMEGVDPPNIPASRSYLAERISLM